MPAFNEKIFEADFGEIETWWTQEEQQLLVYGFQESFITLEKSYDAQEAEEIVETLLDYYFNWGLDHPESETTRLPFALPALFGGMHFNGPFGGMGAAEETDELMAYLRKTPENSSREEQKIEVTATKWVRGENGRQISFTLTMDSNTTAWQCEWKEIAAMPGDDYLSLRYPILDSCIPQ